MDPATITMFYGPVALALDSLGRMLADMDQRAADNILNNGNAVETKVMRLSISMEAAESKVQRLSASIQKLRTSPLASGSGDDIREFGDNCDAMAVAVLGALSEAKRRPGVVSKMKDSLRNYYLINPRILFADPKTLHSRSLDIRRCRSLIEDQREHLNDLIRSSMSASSQPFVHQPLQRPNEQIRLLTMQPGSLRIALTIKHVDLPKYPSFDSPSKSSEISNQELQFRALSYNWGSPEPTRTILIDGKEFSIRDNLYRYLETIKGEDLAPFWIDQICINQSDASERNQQVSVMDQIYEEAMNVVVWLGPASINSDSAMEFINQLDTPDWENLYRNDEWWRKSEDATADGVQELLDKPYWTRLWIVQEILLARKVTLVCGRRSIDWIAFERFLRVPKAIKLLDDFEPSMPFGEVVYSFARNIALEKSMFEDEPYRLSYILGVFAVAACQDPRDKIYGLLGLVDSEKRINIDYSLSLSQIFEKVITKVVESEPHLTLKSHKAFAKKLLGHIGLTSFPLDELFKEFQKNGVEEDIEDSEAASTNCESKEDDKSDESSLITA